VGTARGEAKPKYFQSIPHMVTTTKEEKKPKGDYLQVIKSSFLLKNIYHHQKNYGKSCDN